ncbi:MAG: GAF domain-containing protein [Bryobacteraceae bacterium]|nr:GAF domain-containing protein [Bryobacteraceae bacterium]
MPTDDAAFRKVVSIALQARTLAGLEDMLHEIARQCGGFGVALWQTRHDLEQPQLFVLAHGFESERTICAFDALPTDAATAGCLTEGEVEVEDCSTHPGVVRESVFYRNEKPGSLLSLPIDFPNRARGALTLYRRQTGPTPLADREKFRVYAEHVADLHATVLDRVSYEAIEKVSGLVDSGDHSPAEPGSGELVKICEAIQDSFCAREVSIFLEDWLEEPGRIRCRATTCKALLRKEVYDQNDDGFTPYVWREAKDVHVMHVLNAPKSLREATRWCDAMGIEGCVRRELGLSQSQPTPPISFVAVPIATPDRVLGVLRCHLRPRTPYYFAQRDVDLLHIVASRIGSFWARRLRLREVDASRESWMHFVDKLNGLTERLQLRSPIAPVPFDQTARQTVYKGVLQAVKDAVGGLDVVDVALLDVETRNVSAVAAIGGGGRPVAVAADPPTANAWAYVVHSREIAFIEDTGRPALPYMEVHSGVRQALFIPIISESLCVGVVSLRSMTKIRDVEKAKRMGTLLALVVSLYELVAQALEAQSRVYKELEHQLRTPVFQARKRAATILEVSEQRSLVSGDLQALRGLIAKTYRVLINMKLFADLAGGGKIQAKRLPISLGTIQKTLAEACLDHRILWARKEMQFSFDGLTFDNLKIKEVKLDQSLFEQVINNVLDNGAKYSDPGTDVNVTASIESDNPSTRYLVMTVKNKAGVPLSQEHVQRLGERGFRSPLAIRRTTDGSGLGLYIVKKIMDAHGGELRALPTDPLGLTRIELLFALEEKQ